MGLYDTVRCRYPLPHHQDAEFQTKDLECLLEGNSGMGGSLSEYEITEAGGVRLHVHEREWHDDPNAFLGGYAKSVRDWWEDMPDLHGDIRIYTRDENAEWVEFRIRFTNGAVQDVVEIKRDK